MGKNYFLDQVLEGEQKNELFVFMPFHKDYDDKFEIFKEGAKSAGLEGARRVDEDKVADIITEKIMDGIVNSKILLFDLSDDPKSICGYSKQVNGNVLFELGLALAIRDRQDVILIRDESSESKIPFNIRGVRINEHGSDLKEAWLTELLVKALGEQKWYKSRRVKAAAKSITSEGLQLMYGHGRYPLGSNHFNLSISSVGKDMAAQRLIDLGILFFNWECFSEEFDYAYHWTTFGYAVMEFLGVKRISPEEYKERLEYEEREKANRKFLEYKKVRDKIKDET